MEKSGSWRPQLRSTVYGAALTSLMFCKGTFGYVTANLKAMGMNATRYCKTVLPNWKSDSFLTTESGTDSDILYSILLLLPAEDLLRAQLVCRSWYNIINNSRFIKAHCTRPAPIEAFFISGFSKREFKPLSDKAKFPSAITKIFEDSDTAMMSTNNGLICCRKSPDGAVTFAVGNPTTNWWVDLVDDEVHVEEMFLYETNATLIFDRSNSWEFKLATVAIDWDYSSELKKRNIWFRIYSSETYSWTYSSVYTEIILNPKIVSVDIMCHPCKIGGGSVCWKDHGNCLVGYDISSDTYWKTPLPVVSEKHYSVAVTGYNGDVYFILVGSAEGRVWRLEDKNSWVLEGEAKNKDLEEFAPVPFAYDKARGAMFFGDKLTGKVHAFHPWTGRLEFICQIEGLPREQFDNLRLLPYANNSWASVSGGQYGWGKAKVTGRHGWSAEADEDDYSEYYSMRYEM